MGWWVGVAVSLAFSLSGFAACSEADPPSSAAPAPDPESHRPETAWVEIGDALFELELALDPRTRFRGLGGRRFIPPTGGMLFVNSNARPRAMVMRDCSIPIDVAFLDLDGRVVAMHEMRAEPPRRADESPGDYERRLPTYPSGAPAGFAVETAGGRLAELGVRVGDLLVFDTRALIERAKILGL